MHLISDAQGQIRGVLFLDLFHSEVVARSCMSMVFACVFDIPILRILNRRNRTNANGKTAKKGRDVG